MRDRVWYTKFDAPFGTLFIAATEKGIWRMSLGDASRRELLEQLKDRFGDEPAEDKPHFRRLLNDLKAYFSGEPVDWNHALDLRGTTDFQRKVLMVTRRIPYGETRTYKQIAESVGNPRAYRAVGQALGSNPVPIIVPCHRVIGSDGGLTGFGSGLKTKEWLLHLEGASLRFGRTTEASR